MVNTDVRASSKLPFVAIIILNYNGKIDTFECLNSLHKIGYKNFRIYLVDNGSTEAIENEVVIRFPDIKFIGNNSNLGFTGGNNVGCKAAITDGADYVLLLNNDTVVDEYFLDYLVAECEKDNRIGMATSKIYFYGQDKVLWAYGAKIDRLSARSPHIGVYEYDDCKYDYIREVDRITGCAMLMRREVIDKIGMLDDRFFIYEEELDWCIRARKAGYKLVVVPNSIIWHKGHRDAGRIGRPFIAYLQTRNHFLLLRKHSGFFYLQGTIALIYAFIAVIKSILTAGIFMLVNKERKYLIYIKAVVLGVIDSFRGVFGKPSHF